MDLVGAFTVTIMKNRLPIYFLECSFVLEIWPLFSRFLIDSRWRLDNIINTLLHGECSKENTKLCLSTSFGRYGWPRIVLFLKGGLL